MCVSNCRRIDVIALHDDATAEDPELPPAAAGRTSASRSSRAAGTGRRARASCRRRVPGRRGNRTYDYTLWGVDNFLIPVEPVRLHELLPIVRQRIERECGRPREPRAGLALPPGTITRWRSWTARPRARTSSCRTRAAPRGAGGPDPRVRRRRRGVNLTIVGVLEQGLQFTSGCSSTRASCAACFPCRNATPRTSSRWRPGSDVGAFRTGLRSARFFVYGLRRSDIREQIGQAFGRSQEVLTLMQATWGSAPRRDRRPRVITLRAVASGARRSGRCGRSASSRDGPSTFLIEIARIAVRIGIGVGPRDRLVYKFNVYFGTSSCSACLGSTSP